MIQESDKKFGAQRRLLPDFKALCGCIVEEKDGYVTFVHYSAKE